jgi:hypothetical protein
MQWADNHKAQNPAPLPPLSLTGAGSLFQLIRNMISRSWSFAAEYAKWGIVGAIFLYKMVEWYNSADAAAAGVRADVLPVVPPPEPVKVHYFCYQCVDLSLVFHILALSVCVWCVIVAI